MRCFIVTLFPEAFTSYFDSSIMRKARSEGFLDLILINLADFSVKNTRRSDDRPYGGGPGTILAPEPLERAIEYATTLSPTPIYWIYPDARWERVNHNTLEKISNEATTLWFLCGHYEGIDERVLSYYQVQSLSIGDFVISSGELWTSVLIDGIVRLIPWLLNEDSLKEESFSPWLLGKKEYPQYTRPKTWKWLSVPEVLRSWDPKQIALWKKQDHHTNKLDLS